ALIANAILAAVPTRTDEHEFLGIELTPECYISNGTLHQFGSPPLMSYNEYQLIHRPDLGRSGLAVNARSGGVRLGAYGQLSFSLVPSDPNLPTRIWSIHLQSL